MSFSLEKALRVAEEDARRVYRDLSMYRVTSKVEGDQLRIDYELSPGLSGGGPHYLVDMKSYEITWRRYEQ